MSVREPVWLVCDGRLGKVCLYNEKRAAGMNRCIRHGAILNYASSLNGMSRAEIRAMWESNPTPKPKGQVSE